MVQQEIKLARILLIMAILGKGTYATLDHFNISDGEVVGNGFYEIKEDGVDMNLHLEILSNSLKVQSEGDFRNETNVPVKLNVSAAAANQIKGLEMHNKFRTVHKSPNMTLNAEMCKQAQAYAEDIAKTGQMKHSTREQRMGMGENLSMGCSFTKGQTVEEAVTNWYNEVCNPGYDFNVGGSRGGTGHFTQVVWKESVELGIGIASTTEGGMKCSYIVGRYNPLGNFKVTATSYQENVLKPDQPLTEYCKTINK